MSIVQKFEANLTIGIDFASLVNYDDKISFWNRSMPWYLLNPRQKNKPSVMYS